MSEKKKSENEQLQEKIFLDKKSSWSGFSDEEKKMVFFFCDDYKDFLKKSKTERLIINNVIDSLEKKGFKNIDSVKSAKSGDKIYKNFKDKSVFAFVIGQNKEEFRLIGSHCDSPRLDLKPNPVFEDSELALLKTHYYGGVKKYHWVNTPLALHGVIFTKQGKKITIAIGEKENEPKFIIPDLLPHLAKNQLEKQATKVVEGEELNILIGNMPINDKEIKEQIKFTVLKKLHDDYGIIEEDFNMAEFELVPVGNPIDVGLDRSMIGAYGQDDKVCVFTSLKAILEVKNPKNTALAMFVDKEEIGSVGDTGAASFMLHNFAHDYKQLTGIKTEVAKLLEGSKAISADVTCGMNPNYKDVNDPHNVSYLGKGISIEKYGGGGGKFMTHDASAEYMSYIRMILDKHKIAWQTGELGKIDIGGGGTIAMFLSRYGMDCLDAGPCILGMHSPCEVSSKADVYLAYKLYKAFFED